MENLVEVKRLYKTKNYQNLPLWRRGKFLAMCLKPPIEKKNVFAALCVLLDLTMFIDAFLSKLCTDGNIILSCTLVLVGHSWTCEACPVKLLPLVQNLSPSGVLSSRKLISGENVGATVAY